MVDHEGVAQVDPEEDPRQEEIYRLTVVNRWSQRRIAEHLGITQGRVSQLLAKARETAKLPDLDAVRKEALVALLDLQERSMELAEMRGAPVTAGKDGSVVYDPEDNQVVRDYQLRVMSLKVALAVNGEIRKLMGADAATKTEVSGGVRYEIVGVDPEDLK